MDLNSGQKSHHQSLVQRVRGFGMTGARPFARLQLLWFNKIDVEQRT